MTVYSSKWYVRAGGPNWARTSAGVTRAASDGGADTVTTKFARDTAGSNHAESDSYGLTEAPPGFSGASLTRPPLSSEVMFDSQYGARPVVRW
jgi:hypothetical protein